jgi:group I intron endonuclease
MKIGIYRISNLKNGKVYIGKSVDVEKRMNTHRYSMNRGDSNGSNEALVKDCLKHGIESFQFEILHEISQEDYDKLGQLEIDEILKHQSMNPDHGYNQFVSPNNHKNVLERRNKSAFEKMNKKLKIDREGTGRHTIEQYDLNGKLVKQWRSLKHLIEGFGSKITRQGIHQAATQKTKTGKRKVYKNFHWTITPK